MEKHDNQPKLVHQSGQTSRRIVLIMLAVLVGQLLVTTWFGSTKESYHLDEIYSYGLANSYYQPFLRWNEVSMTWHGPEFYNDYLTVQPQERFTYDAVYYNLAQDNHPPFYFYGLHTVCSFFPDSLSKWFGIGFNMPFLVLTVILLYLLSMLLINDTCLAVLICAAFGFSADAISNTVFIRMYMMLTCWAVLTTYLHGLLIINKTGRLKILLAILVTTTLGFLTQYFFIIYAFFLGAGYLVYLWKQGCYRDLLSYIAAMAGSMLGVILLFPECIKIILGGSMGNKVIGNIGLFADYLSRLTRFAKFIAQPFGGPKLLAVILLSFLIFFLAALLKYRKGHNEWKSSDLPVVSSFKAMTSSRKCFLIIILMTITLTFLTIAKIAPYYSQRYVAFIFPQIALLVVYAGFLVIHGFFGNKRLSLALAALAILLCTSFSYMNGSISYLYRNRADDIDQIMSAYRQYNAYCLTPQTYNLTIAIPLLMRHDNSCYILIDKGAEGIQVMAAQKAAQNQPAVVYIPRWVKIGPTDEELLNNIISSGQYNSYQQLLTREASGLETSVYLLE